MSEDKAFESLPVELIADILSELDLSSLVTVSYLSHRLRAVTSESSLNPWRRPILRTLLSPDGVYDVCLKTLSVRSTVPRHNFVEILSIAQARWLLFEASIPNLKDCEWEECFRRRFLPSWAKVKKEGSWKEAFMKVLYRVWHRSMSSCTSDEAWTRYLTLNRNGTANALDTASRGYSPLTIFEEMRLQNDLLHLPPSVRVIVEFADVRILAIGVLNKPRTSFGTNPNARALLHPPGIEKTEVVAPPLDASSTHTTEPGSGSESEPESEAESDRAVEVPVTQKRRVLNDAYRRLAHPLPVPQYANYPFYTPGGGDARWLTSGEIEEGGMQWVGSMMITAQLIGPHTKESFADLLPLQDLDLVDGPGRNQYASLAFEDLDAIAPWVEAQQIEGPGLGHAD